MSDAEGDPNCPVCRGDGYFFAPPKTPRGRAKYMYCDCEKNIAEGRVRVTSDCFRHGAYDGVFCPTCEREAGR